MALEGGGLRARLRKSHRSCGQEWPVPGGRSRWSTGMTQVETLGDIRCMMFQHFGLHGRRWADLLPELVEGAQDLELPLLEGGRGVLLPAVPRAPSGGHTVGGEVGLLPPLGGELGPEGLEGRHGEGEAWGEGDGL